MRRTSRCMRPICCPEHPQDLYSPWPQCHRVLNVSLGAQDVSAGPISKEWGPIFAVPIHLYSQNLSTPSMRLCWTNRWKMGYRSGCRHQHPHILHPRILRPVRGTISYPHDLHQPPSRPLIVPIRNRHVLLDAVHSESYCMTIP